MNTFCKLNINVEKGVPIGYIFGLDFDIPNFDPRTILCDLRYNKDLFLSLQQNAFYFTDFDYEKEYAFNLEQPLLVDKRDQYVAVVTTIIRFIKESEQKQLPIDMYKIDFLKSYFDINFQFTASNKIDNPFLIYNEHAPKFLELPVHYSHYSVDSALSYNVAKHHNYFYECYSLSDLVYAILHFLALGKYKFSKCPHCGRYFATTSFKQKYCYRNSPYPQFNHLNCEQAVRNILQDLRRLRRAINKNLQENYYTKYEDFFNKSDTLIQIVKKEPSIENIDVAFSYINKERWYKK